MAPIIFCSNCLTPLYVNCRLFAVAIWDKHDSRKKGSPRRARQVQNYAPTIYAIASASTVKEGIRQKANLEVFSLVSHKPISPIRRPRQVRVSLSRLADIWSLEDISTDLAPLSGRRRYRRAVF